MPWLSTHLKRGLIVLLSRGQRPVRSASRGDGLECHIASDAFLGTSRRSLAARILHEGIGGLAFRRLPVSPLKFNSVQGEQAYIKHPMMMVTQSSKIVGMVVCGVMIELGDFLAHRLPAQTAAGVGVMVPCDPASLGLVAFWFGGWSDSSTLSYPVPLLRLLYWV